MPQISDEELIPRIMAHMNKDHVHNLEDYLVVYGHVDLDLAKETPKLDAMDLSSMTLSFTNDRGGRTSVRVPFKHTLNSYRDARSQFVEMAQDAAKKRGFSEYLVNKVPVPNRPIDFLGMGIFLTLWLFAAQPTILETLFSDILKLNEAIVESVAHYVPMLFQFLIIAHSAEAMLLLYPLIRKHRMGTINKLLILGECLVNGILVIKVYKSEIERASTKPSKSN